MGDSVRLVVTPGGIRMLEWIDLNQVYELTHYFGLAATGGACTFVCFDFNVLFFDAIERGPISSTLGSFTLVEARAGSSKVDNRQCVVSQLSSCFFVRVPNCVTSKTNYDDI